MTAVEGVDYPPMVRCQHPRSELRLRLDSLARKMFRGQCLTCGAPTTKPLQKHEWPASAPPWNDDLDRDWGEKIRAQHEAWWQQRKAAESAAWWSAHTAYLASPEWKRRREAVMRRDRGICQACLEAPATEVHHKTYEHHMAEPLFELVAICRPCHERITEMDRARRGER